MRGEQLVCFTADRFHFFVCRYDESGEPQIEDINAWFDELDTNKDGVVTLEEYKVYFLKPDENGHTVSFGFLRFIFLAVFLWIVLRRRVVMPGAGQHDRSRSSISVPFA